MNEYLNEDNQIVLFKRRHTPKRNLLRRQKGQKNVWRDYSSDDRAGVANKIRETECWRVSTLYNHWNSVETRQHAEGNV